MSIGWLFLLALLSYVLACLLCQALAEYWLESSTSKGLEWALTLLIGWGFYLLSLSWDTRPWLGLVLGVLLGVLFFLTAFGLGLLMREWLAWEELEPGGPLLPVVLGGSLILLFIPTGLGPTIGYPQLFQGSQGVFALALAAELSIMLLKGFMLQFFDEEVLAEVMEWFLTILLTLSCFFFLVPHGRGPALVVSLLISLAIALEGFLAIYLLDHCLGWIDGENPKWTSRFYLLASCGAALLLCYLFSVLSQVA